LSEPPSSRTIDPALQTDPALPPELETRISILERTAPREDFDSRSWIWIILLGLIVPVLLLVIGWNT